MSSQTVDYEQIKQRVSISEVLSRYTRVPQKDKYRIPCLLHGGDGPNFGVDENRGLFHCFTCGAAGDVITLLAKLEGIPNSQAAWQLVEQFGIKGTPEVRNFRGVLNDAKNWTPRHQLPEISLPESKRLNGYRRFSAETIDYFGLRLVPNGVLTPFRDLDGRYVGYSIRQINMDPKYLNSKGLKKSEIVYGLYENRYWIKDQNHTAIVCEGQFSAMRVWQTLRYNVVATLGASMSPTQAQLIALYANRLIILYDGDEAGRAGAQKLKESYSAMFRIEIKTLREGTDPDNADLEEIFNDGE